MILRTTCCVGQLRRALYALLSNELPYISLTLMRSWLRRPATWASQACDYRNHVAKALRPTDRVAPIPWRSRSPVATIPTVLTADMSAFAAILSDPTYHDYLAILKGARNGLVYGVKVRFPHALIMAILFGRGE